MADRQSESPACVLCLLRQYGFVMGEARGEANKHDASLPASTLRAAEPFAEPDPETEPEAEPADAAEPNEAQVAEAHAEAVAAAAAAAGGSHAPCKRQRGGDPQSQTSPRDLPGGDGLDAV